MTESKTVSKQNTLSKLLLGWLIPIAIASAGVGVYLGLGQQAPKQVATDLSDPRVVLTRMPMVNVDTLKRFE